jgi:hypothetical protein
VVRFGSGTRTAPVVRALPAPGQYLCGLTFDRGRLWHSDQDAGRIWALDPGTGEVTTTFGSDRVRADLTTVDGLLAQVGGRPKRLVLFDPGTGEEVGERAVHPPSGRLCGVETAPEGIWAGLVNPSVVQLRDPVGLQVLREFTVPGVPSGLTVAAGLVVYSDFGAGVIRALHPETGGLVGEVAVEGHPTGTTWDGEHVWYCDFAGRRLAALRLADITGGAS